MKIGRNDKCPCGSGKKYKNCCLNKDFIDNDNQKFIMEYKRLKNLSRIKQCLYPNCSCSAKEIINSHSIQNSKILNKISDNGKVFMCHFQVNNGFILPGEFGRSVATVFTGFCKKHDKELFQDIEDKDFNFETKQIFLYLYRAMIYEYHKKLEAVKLGKIIKEQYKLSEDNVLFFRGFNMATNDLEYEKEFFDKAILHNKFDILTTIVYQIPKFCNFAASGIEAPTKDFDGNIIQEFKNKLLGHIYYSVFPENNSTYILIGWLKRYDKLFKNIKIRLQNLSNQEIMNYINNTLLMVSENIAIKPSAYANLTKEQQEEIISNLMGFSGFKEFLGMNADRFSTPGFDLFSL